MALKAGLDQHGRNRNKQELMPLMFLPKQHQSLGAVWLSVQRDLSEQHRLQDYQISVRFWFETKNHFCHRCNEVHRNISVGFNTRKYETAEEKSSYFLNFLEEEASSASYRLRWSTGFAFLETGFLESFAELFLSSGNSWGAGNKWKVITLVRAIVLQEASRETSRSLSPTGETLRSRGQSETPKSPCYVARMCQETSLEKARARSGAFVSVLSQNKGHSCGRANLWLPLNIYLSPQRTERVRQENLNRKTPKEKSEQWIWSLNFHLNSSGNKLNENRERIVVTHDLSWWLLYVNASPSFRIPLVTISQEHAIKFEKGILFLGWHKKKLFWQRWRCESHVVEGHSGTKLNKNIRPGLQASVVSNFVCNSCTMSLTKRIEPVFHPQFQAAQILFSFLSQNVHLVKSMFNWKQFCSNKICHFQTF